MVKKKHLSDLMRKRDNKVVNENPFEIKTNKRRHEVMGQKVMKWEKGKPGVNKSKWMKERMETLLVEHHNKNKDNRIKDKTKVVTTIPRKTGSAVERYKADRKNLARLYNLDDDDEGDQEAPEMTHKGRLVSEIEKFEDQEKDSDDEEDEKEFREKFAEVQFGGQGQGGKKDISQLIFDSIVEKNERNKEKRQQADLKEDILKEFEENLPAFREGLKKPGEDKQTEQADDLMMKLNMLKNAPRCTPADVVVSSEKEKAKENKMEKERLARMNPQKRTLNHRSADDLDDDLYLATTNKRVRFTDDVDKEDEYEDTIPKERLMNLMRKKDDDDEEGDDEEEDGDDDEEEGDDDEEEEGDDEEGDDDEGDDDDEEDDEDEGEEVDDDDKIEEDTEDVSVATFSSLLDSAEFSSPENFCDLINTVYKASRKNPVSCAQVVAGAIYDIHLDLQVKLEKNKRALVDMPKDFKLIFLTHLVGNIYSTSDYQHPVVTPTMIVMSQLLTQGAIKSMYDVAYGLLLCSYFLVYTQDSKRFVPEVINHLTSIISLHSTARDEFYTKNVKKVDMLVVTEDMSSEDPPRFVTLNSTFSKEAPEYLESKEFKLSSLLTALKLAKTSFEYYSHLPSSRLAFKPICDAIKGINISNYPQVVKERLEELSNLIGSLKHPTSRLIRSDCKPVPLPQYSLKLKDNTKRGKKGEGLKKEELTKYKKIQKDIQREVKKEQNLRNKIQFDELVKEKHMRKEKTKRIINELANQEGEFNAMMKRKKIEGKKEKVEKF